MATLTDIRIYPIKSTRGLSISRSAVMSEGLAFDRRWMLVDSHGRMLTGRALPALVQVTTALVPQGLLIRHPAMPELMLNYQEFAGLLRAGHVWKDEFEASTTTTQADNWFSELLKRDCHLLYCGDSSVRTSQKAKQTVSFADAFPLLLISRASLKELNRRSPVAHKMAQFRPNLVVDESLPFAEDGWSEIRIGEVRFRLDCPCSRCIFTTRDPVTGDFIGDKEPLATLKTFRQNNKGDINFGMNLLPLNEGVIEIGTEVEILSSRQPEQYQEGK